MISVIAKGCEDHLRPKLAKYLPILLEETKPKPENVEKLEDLKTATKQEQDMEAHVEKHQLKSILNDWNHDDF